MSGQHVDELISASLSGELSDLEQAGLEAHLRGCAECRDTMAAFSNQRRMVSGLRHVAPPANLPARIRTGLESGALAERPWWRRAGGILTLGAGLAAMAAAAALALAVLNITEGPPVGASASPSPSVAGTPTPAPTASPESTPASTPVPAGVLAPGEIGFLSLSGVLGSQQLSLQGYDPATAATRELVALDTPAGPPVAATLSPSGEWLAYQTVVGQKGTREIWVVRLSDGETRNLGETGGDDPFTKRMTWSIDGRFLAYTGLFGEGAPTLDVGLFDSQDGTSRQLTFLQSAYAASFDGERLWMSVAGDIPTSYLVPLDGDLSDPATAAIRTLDATFLPMLSPDGTRSIFWRGRMVQQGFGWVFATGGMPYLAGGTDQDPFAAETQLFSTLVAGQNAFLSAEVAWGLESDWFAVWNAAWTGDTQTGASGELFPDSRYIYFGRAATANLINPETGGWIDLTVAGQRSVVDVTLVAGPDATPQVMATVQQPGGGESEGAPGEMAHLVLNAPAPTGWDPDATIGDPLGWNGPAVLGPGS